MEQRECVGKEWGGNIPLRTQLPTTWKKAQVLKVILTHIVAQSIDSTIWSSTHIDFNMHSCTHIDSNTQSCTHIDSNVHSSKHIDPNTCSFTHKDSEIFSSTHSDSNIRSFTENKILELDSFLVSRCQGEERDWDWQDVRQAFTPALLWTRLRPAQEWRAEVEQRDLSSIWCKLLHSDLYLSDSYEVIGRKYQERDAHDTPTLF